MCAEDMESAAAASKTLKSAAMIGMQKAVAVAVLADWGTYLGALTPPERAAADSLSIASTPKGATVLATVEQCLSSKRVTGGGEGVTSGSVTPGDKVLVFTQSVPIKDALCAAIREIIDARNARSPSSVPAICRRALRAPIPPCPSCLGPCLPRPVLVDVAVSLSQHDNSASRVWK